MKLAADGVDVREGKGMMMGAVVRRTKTRSCSASIQQLVPVNPVWPKASSGKTGPAVESFVAASCHAKERASFKP